MAQTVHLPDGTMEVLFNEAEDFQRLIAERLGRDAEEIVTRLFAGRAYEEAKVNSDLGSYEASLESNHRAFNDLLDQLKELENELSKNRLNRNKLITLAAECRTIIKNQI